MAPHPLPWVLAVTVFEAAAGAATLRGGRARLVGLAASAVFVAALTPAGPYTPGNPVVAALPGLSVRSAATRSRQPPLTGRQETEMRIALTVFLVGHAAVHAVMWTLPFTDATREMPFDPGHSWVFSDSRVPAGVLAGVATVGFVVSAVGFVLQAGWWPVAMLAASVVSLVLMIGWFTPWWLVGIALSAGLAVFAWQSQPVT